MKPSLRSKARRLLQWVRMLPLILAGIVAGCGGSLTPAQHAEREKCLTEAFAAFDRRAGIECPGDWDTCPLRDALMADYAAKQRACPNAR